MKKKTKFSLMVILTIIPILNSCVPNNIIELPDPATGENGSEIKFEHSQKSKLNYIITLPANYFNEPGANYPLIIFLHSLEERETGIEKVLNNPDGEGWGLAHYASTKEDFPFITVSPLCPKTTGWSIISGKLKKLTDEIIEVYSIDESRIYLTGVSMGGMGTWDFAADCPDLFAAASPISGGGYPVVMNNNPKKIVNIPIWAFHDRNDPSIKLEDEVNYINKLKKAGGNVKYTITDKGLHYIYSDIYYEDYLFQ